MVTCICMVGKLTNLKQKLTACLTLYEHIQIAEQRSIIQQYCSVIGTLAVDGWAVTFGTAKRACARCGPAQSPHRCTKCNSPSTNGQCTNFILFNVAL